MVSRTILTAGDVFLWQVFASFVIPGAVVNRVQWATSKYLSGWAKGSPQMYVPTALALLVMPLIINPVDNIVDFALDSTYRLL